MNNKENKHPLIKLIYKNLEHFFENEQALGDLDKLSWLNKKYLKKKAGVFVSYHKKGNLRGCIGTFQPTQDNIAQEVIRNSLQAAFYDHRFSPLTYSELEQIKVSLDILKKPHEIKDLKSHNPKEKGLIVTGKGQSGLLLPDIDGIDSAQKQRQICLKKAGLAFGEEEKLEAFEVTRIKEQ